MRAKLSAIVLSCTMLAGASARGERVMSLELMSSAFDHQSRIPAVFTCDGKNISPPLSWSGAPEATKSYALIVDDPDAPDPKAPKRVFVHWVLFDVPASVRSLPEGVTGASLPPGAAEGTNDMGKRGYHGPCPPIGTHRYFFKLYALDAPALQGLENPTKADLERAMEGHVLAKTELIGTYARPPR